MYADPVAAIQSLECTLCRRRIPLYSAANICPDCSAPLLVRYSADALKHAEKPPAASPSSMARYASLLPDSALTVSLGEGWTPLLPSRRHPHLFIKDEAANPSGSTHARRAAVAVSMALRGVKKLVAAVSSNEGISLAAYSAAAGLPAHFFLPQSAATARPEMLTYGAALTLVDGSLADCVRRAEEAANEADTHNLTALCEPFGIEGSKTLGLEIAEQLAWRYPAAILCSADDNATLIGLTKSFEELESAGWVSGRRPQLIAVQSTLSVAAAPSTPGVDATLSITPEAIHAALLHWARHEGILLSPPGAAAAAAWDQLRHTGQLPAGEPVVLIQPASGIRNIAAPDNFSPGTKKYPRRTPVGGIITPQ
jgi:threonine synthase